MSQVWKSYWQTFINYSNLVEKVASTMKLTDLKLSNLAHRRKFENVKNGAMSLINNKN